MARVPIGTTQWGDDLNADLDSIEAQINNHKAKQGPDNPHGLTPADIGAAEEARVADLEAAPPAHADSHAEGGSDVITPGSIGAVNGVAIQPPGGWADMDANALLEAGRYALYAGTSQNVPSAGGGVVGILEVLPRLEGASTQIYQRWTVMGDASGDPIGEWIRGTYDSGTTWGPWKRLIADDDPRLLDTGWRRLFSWTDGVQDASGQIGTIRTDNYTLSGSGYIDLRRVGSNVRLRSNNPANTFSTHSDSNNSDFSDALLPAGFAPFVGSAGTRVDLHVDSSSTRLGLRINGGAGSTWGFVTPGGGSGLTRVYGSWWTEQTFPSEPYPGTPV